MEKFIFRAVLMLILLVLHQFLCTLLRKRFIYDVDLVIFYKPFSRSQVYQFGRFQNLIFSVVSPTPYFQYLYNSDFEKKTAKKANTRI